MNKTYLNYENFPKIIRSGLRILTSFFTRLTNLAGVTQDDLEGAGVVIHRRRD